MRVLIVSQYYAPEPVILPPSVAAGLTERGHDVRVITGFPNYPEGRLSPGYRQRWRAREHGRNGGVLRVPLIVDHSQNPVLRIANYLTFGLSSATAFRAARRADIVYVYAPQMTAALGPWLWRYFGGPPYVLHIQDLWPESILGSSLVRPGRASALAARGLERWLRVLYRHASAVVAIAPGMRAALIERGADPSTTHLVFNWADEPSPAPEPMNRGEDRRSGTLTETRVVFAGNVGMMQDLSTAIRAAHAVRDLRGFSLSIVGGGAALDDARRLRDELRADNVTFTDRVSPDQMERVYRESDFQLVSLKDLPVFHHTIPSKLQSAFAHSKPVIVSVPGDAARIVHESGAGLVAAPGDVRSLEQCFRSAAALDADARSAAARRANDYYKANMSMNESLARIEKVLRGAARPSTEPRSRGIST